MIESDRLLRGVNDRGSFDSSCRIFFHQWEGSQKFVVVSVPTDSTTSVWPSISLWIWKSPGQLANQSCHRYAFNFIPLSTISFHWRNLISLMFGFWWFLIEQPRMVSAHFLVISPICWLSRAQTAQRAPPKRLPLPLHQLKQLHKLLLSAHPRQHLPHKISKVRLFIHGLI